MWLTVPQATRINVSLEILNRGCPIELVHAEQEFLKHVSNISN